MESPDVRFSSVLSSETSAKYVKMTNPKVRGFLDRYNLDMGYGRSYVKRFGKLTDTKEGLQERAIIHSAVKEGDAVIDDEALSGEVETSQFHYFFDIIGDTIIIEHRIPNTMYNRGKIVEEEYNDVERGTRNKNTGAKIDTGIRFQKLSYYHFGDDEETGGYRQADSMDGQKSDRITARNPSKSKSNQGRRGADGEVK